MSTNADHTLTNKSSYKWVIVIIFFLYCGISWGGTQASNGVYFNPISDNLNLSRTSMSTAFAILLAIGFSGSVLWGKLADSWSIRWVLAISGALFAAGFFLASFAESLIQFIICYSVIGGLGLSGTFSPLTGTTMRWFPPRQRGFAFGLSIAGVGAGTALMPPLADYLIHSEGWRYTFKTFGVIMLVLALLATLLAKEPAVHRNKSTPDQLSPTYDSLGLSLASIVKSQGFWLIFGMNMTTLTILQLCLVHLVPRAIDSGIDPSMAARLIAILGLSSILGKTVGGYLTYQISVKSVYITGIIINMTVLIAINLGDMLWLYILFATCFGIGYGACMPQSTVIAAQFFGTKHMSTVAGALSQANMLGGIVGPLMAGILFDITGTYTIPFLIAASLGVLGITCCTMARAPTKSVPRPNLHTDELNDRIVKP